MSDQVPYAVAHRVEEAFVSFLRSASTLTGLEIVAASDRGALVPPLHCFVLCAEATAQQNYGPIFKAQVRIVVVSNVDDTEHAVRRQWVEAVMSHLTSVTDYDYRVSTEDTDTSLSLMGPWAIGTLESIGSGQQTGDVIPLVCGVLVPIGAAEIGTATTDGEA